MSQVCNKNGEISHHAVVLLVKMKNTEVMQMKKVDYKGRVIKRQLSKCKEVCRSYSEMQDDYARFLQIDDNVKGISKNPCTKES